MASKEHCRNIQQEQLIQPGYSEKTPLKNKHITGVLKDGSELPKQWKGEGCTRTEE